jgi:heparanase 1
MRRLLAAALGLAFGSPLDGGSLSVLPSEEAPTRDEVVAVSLAAPAATIDARFLSVAVDSAQVVGATFWNPDAGPELPGGTHPVAPYDFARPRLRRLARELAPSYLRIGGTTADTVYYDMSAAPVATPPAPYRAVLTRAQWDSVNAFAMALDYRVAFTLNAGPGPRDANDAWRPDNARALLEYSHARHYPVALWDLGNEANVFPVMVRLGYSVSAAQLARDAATARALIDSTTPGALLAAPSSAYWPIAGELFPISASFLAAGGGRAIDVVTWHYYPQQSRRCLVATRRASPQRMLDPSTLDELDKWAARVESVRDRYARGKPVWLGESGNAQCGGEPGVSDAFVSGFWWLDELGRAARRGQSVVVRQTLSGSNYGLIDDVSLSPRPDYWTAVLWRRLMGERVLDAPAGAHPLLRVYAHCTRAGAPDSRPGAVTLAVVNLDRSSAVSLALDAFGGTADVYELSSSELVSPEIRLNGVALRADDDGAPPELSPRVVHRDALPLRARFGPATYGFVVLPDAAAPACL